MLSKRLGKIGFLFSLPAVLFFLLFISIPVLFTIFLSFASWKGFDLAHIQLIGLNNYGEMFRDKTFWLSFSHTFIFVALTTLFLNLFGFIGAMIIDSGIRGTRFLKNAIFLPVLLSPIIIGIMWSRMLDAFGIINKFLQVVHLTKLPVLFLGSPDIALYTIIIATIWQFTGYDLLLNIIGGFKIFDIVYVMTAGGPNHHSEVLATYLFLQAFRFNKMGPASVIAIVIIALSLFASLIRMKITRQDT